MYTQNKILIVDDDAHSIMLIEAYFKHFGFNGTLLKAFNAISAIEKADKEEPDIIIMDVLFADDTDGIEAAEIIKSRHEKASIIFITAYSDPETISRAMRTNPLAYVVKPVGIEKINELFNKYVNSSKIHQEIETIEQPENKIC